MTSIPLKKFNAIVRKQGIHDLVNGLLQGTPQLEELNIQGILDIKKQPSLLASASYLRKLELPVELNSNDIYGLAAIMPRLIWINQNDCIVTIQVISFAPQT